MSKSQTETPVAPPQAESTAQALEQVATRQVKEAEVETVPEELTRPDNAGAPPPDANVALAQAEPALAGVETAPDAVQEQPNELDAPAAADLSTERAEGETCEPAGPSAVEQAATSAPGQSASAPQAGLEAKPTTEATAVGEAGQPPPAEAEAGLAAAASPPAVSLMKRIWRALDAALDAINRPFGWLNDEARQLVGLVALVTLVVSIAAMILMPLLVPRRDALTLLREQVAQLRKPAASAPAATLPDD